MILYVETHWILSCVLRQDEAAPRLLEHREEHGHVVMPAFCVAEAIARFRTLEKEAHDFRSRLEQTRREATRMDLEAAANLALALENVILEQDLLGATLPKEFSHFMERLFASSVEQVPVDAAIARRSIDYVERFDLSRGDAFVLATVVDHASNHVDVENARGFLSGNTRDFGPGTPAREELRRVGITFFSKVAGALGWMTAARAG